MRKLKCTGCLAEKSERDFYPKKCKRGFAHKCKSCECAGKQKYYQANRAEIVTRVKLHTGKNRDAVKKYHAGYYVKNKEAFRTYKREYMRRRLGSEIDFKLKQLLRDRIRKALKKSYKKAAGTAALVGCSMSDFRRHIESKFRDGMTWENHGRKGWHIDHVRPVSSFDFNHESQQRECFHYTNMQPLWAEENHIKSNKWNG
jgi:hypothetical protein